MKLSGPKQPRVPAKLGRSLMRHLDAYEIAAAAAGVAALACASPAHASPVCGKLALTFSLTETYAFNPAHQDVAPFNIAQTYANKSSLSIARRERGFFTPNTPSAKVIVAASGFPANVASGASIGPGGKFSRGKSYGLVFGYYVYSLLLGNFKSGDFGYVGFQFSESGKPHYGWMRIKVKLSSQRYVYPSLVLSEFGYESSPNTAIAAGNCGSSASQQSAKADKKAEANARSSSTGNIRQAVPASLGMLALGSEGIPLWREQLE